MKNSTKHPSSKKPVLTRVAGHHYNVIQAVRRASIWAEANDRVEHYLSDLRNLRASCS